MPGKQALAGGSPNCREDPLLAGHDELLALMQRRRPFYATAHLCFDAAGDSVDGLAGALLPPLRFLHEVPETGSPPKHFQPCGLLAAIHDF